MMATMQTATRPDFLTYSHTIGICVMRGRGFYCPVDTAIGENGRLYVVSRSLDGDPAGARVTVCSPDSEFFRVFGSGGEGDGEFVWPVSIACDRQGRVHVADEHTHLVSVFDAEGSFVAKWGVHGSAPGELDGPAGMAFDEDDNLFVADQLNNRVQKFTKDGAYLSGFGAAGAGEGQLNRPWGVAVGPNGEVYVADWRNDRVQRFSPDGDFVAAYGSSGLGDGEFHRPSSVAVDPDGYIYVADWGNERVQVLDPDGAFVAKYRGEATLSKWAEEFMTANVDEATARSKSEMEPDLPHLKDDPHEESSHIEKLFWGPVSVKVDGSGRLYVTEANRHRVQVYQRSKASG